MEDNISKLKEQIDFYNKRYKILQDEIPKFNYYIADDMIETFRKFAETNEQLAHLRNYPESLRKSNGQIIFTIDNREFIILINKSQFNDTKDYIHTIIHEYTHVLDYFKYMNENNIINFDKFIKKKIFYAVYLWTEYRARVLGTKNFYESYIFKEYKNIKGNKSAIKEFVNTQIQPHIDRLLNELSEFEENKRNPKLPTRGTFIRAMYNITQHFARFFVFYYFGVNVLQKPNFPIDELYRLFGDRINDYYKVLSNYNFYNKEKFDFEKLDKIIDDIYKYTLEH